MGYEDKAYLNDEPINPTGSESGFEPKPRMGTTIEGEEVILKPTIKKPFINFDSEVDKINDDVVTKEGIKIIPNPVKRPKTSPIDEIIPISASCIPINPNTLSDDGYELQDQEIIPQEDITGSFQPGNNVVELFTYDADKSLTSVNYNYKGWTTGKNTDSTLLTGSYTNDQGIEVVINDPPTSSITDAIELNPPLDAFRLGFGTGQIFTAYNFINYELGSSPTNSGTFYIASISGDRTEISIKSNFIQPQDIVSGYNNLSSSLATSQYADEFYISLFNNDYQIGVNLSTPSSSIDLKDPTILIKLYDPLPQQFGVKSELYVATKVGESVAYKVTFIDEDQSLGTGVCSLGPQYTTQAECIAAGGVWTFINANYIKGPNINISLQDLVNNSTALQSKEDLTKTTSTASLNNVLNLLNTRGVTITPDYSYNTFNEFVNFSSAKERVNNFYEKVSQIQSYEADIEAIQTTVAGNPNVNAISQSLASLQTNVTNLIENFDGYETYLYYNTSSLYAYPKTGSTYPFELLPTNSTTVLNWLGSDVESNVYYGGIINSASLYDEGNQNWLYYTIPQYIVDNNDNVDYITFCNMVGQSFDEVWIYTRALSERYNTTNDPNSGLPLGLAADAIKGMGFETFGNNYDNQDNFIGLAGADAGMYTPPTGSELITKYVAVNNGQIINYWDPGYSFADYVEEITEAGFPYAIDKVSKEIYKRLYHNMSSLTKRKGTISGLRQLINIWGIPNTILRINEFGGKNRDNSNDYDLWYNRFSYAYTPVAGQARASSSVLVPWMPLERNAIADVNEAGDTQFIVPDGVGMRFKTTGFPSSSYGGNFRSQSLMSKKSNGIKANTAMDWGVGLHYDDQPSGSYSGSSFSDYYEYGKLTFWLSGSSAQGGVASTAPIYLPFFNKGWWTILLQRDTHVSQSNNTSNTTYTLYAANNQYNGADGNTIGWTGSSSITVAGGFSSSLNESWNAFGTGTDDGVYVGGYISGSRVGDQTIAGVGKIFSGSLQEFRYYSHAIGEEVFFDFTMNPESVEGNAITGSQSSFDIVNFRAPLGNELEYLYTSSGSSLYITEISSSHPAITGSSFPVYTQSFVNPADLSTTSSYKWIVYDNLNTRTYSKPNYEVYQLDQPAIGIRNRVSNKVQVADGDAYGKVLSRQISIDQDYLQSSSYTEDTTDLEVGFSPQDEVNDDIIATYGYGAISSVIADPRFVTSSLTYYPGLKNIAKDYFKKYSEGSVWDYLRLIKYFDNSLFKAIKSYVPARTSVTTGVIIKQHMLERNRIKTPTVDPRTEVAFFMTGSPTTVSLDTGALYGTGVYGTGLYGLNGLDSSSWAPNSFNNPIFKKDLVYNAEIPVITLDGGTSGQKIDSFTAGPGFETTLYTTNTTSSLNKLVKTGSLYYSGSGIALVYNTGQNPIFRRQSTAYKTGSAIYFHENLSSQEQEMESTRQLRSKFSFLVDQNIGPSIVADIVVTSSIRGVIWNEEYTFGDNVEVLSSATTTPNTVQDDGYITIYPNERLIWNITRSGGSGTLTGVTFRIGDLPEGDHNGNSIQGEVVSLPAPNNGDPMSQQGWFEYTPSISGSVRTFEEDQRQFYNGEYSGSEFVAMTQSLLNNPFAPSQTPDTSYHMNVIANTDNVGGSFASTLLGNLYQANFIAKVYDGSTVWQADYNEWKVETFPNRYGNTAMTGSIVFVTIPGTAPLAMFVHAIIMPSQVTVNPFGGSPAGTNLPLSEMISNNPVPTPVAPTTKYSPFTDVLDSGIGVMNYINPWIKFQQWNPGDNVSQFSIYSAPPFNDSGVGGAWDSSQIHTAYLGRSQDNIGNLPKVTREFGGQTLGYWNSTIDPNALASLGEDLDYFTLYEYPLTIEQFTLISSENQYGKSPIRPVVWAEGGPETAAQAEAAIGGSTNPLGDYAISLNFNISKYETIKAGYNDLAQSTIENAGTGSIYLVGTSWTSSNFYDFGDYTPTNIMFSKDAKTDFFNGTQSIIDNSATLLNNPTFKFSLPQSSSLNVPPFGGMLSTFGPLNSIPPTLISTDNLYPDGGEGNNLVATPGGEMIGYRYIPQTIASSPSVVLSGSSYKSSGGIGIAGSLYTMSFASRQYIPFNPQLPATDAFYNTPFNPLINNATSSIKNTYIEKLEFDDGAAIPSNIEAVINRTAQKADVPDSLYVSKTWTNPRYNGTEIFSADYNFYTAPETQILYLNNLSGSIISESNQTTTTSLTDMPPTNSILSPQYLGDVSYGNQSVIDKNPIYFARFVSSKDNPELEGTYTFRINQLIECPRTEILGDKAPESPVVINIDGSNINLMDVTNTFEIGRKASVAYDEGSVQYSSSATELAELGKGNTINYTALKVGDNLIYQGGLEYNTLITNQNTPDEFVSIMSFSTASFLSIAGPGYLVSVPMGGNARYGSTSGPAASTGCPSWLEASSSMFRLGGDIFRVTGSAGVNFPAGNQYLTGPVLGLMHSFNQRINKGFIANANTATTTDQRFGIPEGLKDPKSIANDNRSYFTFNFSESIAQNVSSNELAVGLSDYENFDLPFLIQPNDEIRVTYATGSAATKVLQTQDFTVMSVPTSSITTNYRALNNAAQFGAPDKINIYDEIHVHPDPLNFNFQNNRIYNFTIRRRVNADDRVIIFQSAPPNSRGINTITPSGYIIPGDFSPIQNRNVLTLINQLKAKNANPNPPIPKSIGRGLIE